MRKDKREGAGVNETNSIAQTDELRWSHLGQRAGKQLVIFPVLTRFTIGRKHGDKELSKKKKKGPHKHPE